MKLSPKASALFPPNGSWLISCVYTRVCVRACVRVFACACVCTENDVKKTRRKTRLSSTGLESFQKSPVSSRLECHRDRTMARVSSSAPAQTVVVLFSQPGEVHCKTQTILTEKLCSQEDSFAPFPPPKKTTTNRQIKREEGPMCVH